MYRVSRISNVQTWAIGQLKILMEHSNRDYAVKETEIILEKLNDAFDKEEKRRIGNLKLIMG